MIRFAPPMLIPMHHRHHPAVDSTRCPTPRLTPHHLLRRCRRVLAVAWITGGLALTSGCLAGAELALLGAASNAAQSTEAVAKRGKISSAHRASFEEVKAAAEWALVDVGLTIERTPVDDEEEFKVHAQGTGDAFVTVSVFRETPSLTLSQVSVGLFGDVPVARLVLQQMRVALGEIKPTQPQEPAVSPRPEQP